VTGGDGGCAEAFRTYNPLVNDNVEKLGGRPPTTLEAFIVKHRAVFV
jgi:hypothetical protein